MGEKLIWGLRTYYKDGMIKDGIIWTERKRVAKRWKEQKTINNLVIKVELIAKVLNKI